MAVALPRVKIGRLFAGTSSYHCLKVVMHDENDRWLHSAASPYDLAWRARTIAIAASMAGRCTSLGGFVTAASGRRDRSASPYFRSIICRTAVAGMHALPGNDMRAAAAHGARAGRLFRREIFYACLYHQCQQRRGHTCRADVEAGHHFISDARQLAILFRYTF